MPRSRKGAGGRTPSIGAREKEHIERVLYENAYDVTFAEIETTTGISKSTAWRYMKKNK